MAKKQKQIVIAPEDLPKPGTSGELEVDGFQIIITNMRDPNEMRDGDVVGYSGVVVERDGNVSSTIHAAAIRKAGRRTRIARNPLCNRDGGTRVLAKVTQEVTCSRCLGHLEAAGFAPS